MTLGSTSPGSGNIFRKILTVGFALLGIGLILWLDSWFMDHAGMPDLTGDLNFGLLFLIGF